jgi:hypothetical protein
MWPLPEKAVAAGEECAVVGWALVGGPEAALEEGQVAPSVVAPGADPEEALVADLEEAPVVASGEAVGVVGELAAGAAIVPK